MAVLVDIGWALVCTFGGKRRTFCKFRVVADQFNWPGAIMAQSLSLVIVHVIFSTKDRRPFIDASLRPALFAYLSTVARNMDCAALQVGGVADHVHIAVQLARTVTIAKLVEALKTSSSKWLKAQSPLLGEFSWQRGYGCFSVGPGSVDALRAYIQTQDEHHRGRSFEDEFRAMLNQYGLAFDEAYVWD